MRIIVISTPIFQTPVSGYAGLEVIAYEQARGLAALGHEVALVAPDGSTCPGVQIVPCGPAGQVDEKSAFGGFPEVKDGNGNVLRRVHPGYWQALIQADVVIDHSVAGDECLLVRIDGQCRWMSFDELYQWALTRGTPTIERGSVEVPVRGLEVPSALGIHKVAWKPASAVIRHRRKDSIHRVRTEGGFTVDVTSGHSLMVAGHGDLVSVRADVSKGKHAAVARRIPATNKEVRHWPVSCAVLSGCMVKGPSVTKVIVNHKQALLTKALRDEIKPESAVSRIRAWEVRSVPFDSLPEKPTQLTICVYGDAEMQWPVELTDDCLTLMGLWVGDGCYDGCYSLLLSAGERTRHVGDSVARLFGAVCIPSTDRPDVGYRINSKLLVRMFKEAGFDGDCYTKKIPDWIFGLNRRQIGLFLRGYFSADGCSGRVCLNSVNQTLIRQVSVLMALCGLRHNISKGAPGVNPWNGESSLPIWELTVPNDQYRKFVRRVGFVQAGLNEDILKRTPARKSWRGDVPYCLVREKTLRVGAKESVLSLSKLERYKGSVVAAEFSTSALSWRKVTESAVTARDDEYVYDLSVPETENFFVGLVCCHNSWQKWSYSLKAEGALKAPVLGWFHAPVNTMYGQWPPTYPRLPPVEKACPVCISDDQASHFQALHNRPARVCYNGIDPEHYKPIPGVKRTDRFLFLARFSTIKGPAIAIEACLKAGVGLDLVGDTTITGEPQYLEHCMKLAQQESPGWDRSKGKQIVVHGGCSRGETVMWYSKAHALLHSAKDFREPFGLAPVEAMACGCPVLCFNNGALRETVWDGETGLIAETVQDFTEYLTCWWVQNIGPNRRNDCRRRALNFTVEKMAERCEELCNEAVSSGGW